MKINSETISFFYSSDSGVAGVEVNPNKIRRNRKIKKNKKLEGTLEGTAK
jgi:hypothetical protein